jgi:membrane-associated phospholipid phosphatase
MRYLAMLLWPAGLVVIAAAGALLARRAPAPRRARPAPRAWPGSRARARAAAGSPPGGRYGAAAEAVRIGLLAAAGAAGVYLVMAALGTLVVHAGPALDQPAYHWIVAHRIPAWSRLLGRLTKIGDTWTTWGAALAAAACLAASVRTRRWLPPFLLLAAVVADHYVTLALRHTFHRIGPPGSPGGTFPSGGTDRVVLVYGLIAFLLWRALSGQRRTAIWAGAAVAALAFNEAYSRAYLTLHWLTDVGSGLLYGALMLSVFIAATRLVTGPAEPAMARSAPPAAIRDGAAASSATSASSAQAPA